MLKRLLNKLLKNILTILVICFLLVLCKTSALGQQYPIRTYTTSDGLVQNTVLGLLQDNSGRIWIGTTGGISCYDGVSFTNYSKENGLSGVRGYAIYQDSEQAFWLGSEEGVTKLEFIEGKEKFTSFTKKDGLKTEATHVILQHNNSYFFAGSGGIFKYDGKAFEDVLAKYNLPSERFRTGFKDKSGNLWFGSAGKLLKLTPNNGDFQVKTYDQNDGLDSSLIRGIYQDPKGDIWLALYGKGIARLVEESSVNKFEYFTIQNGLPTNVCYSVITDSFGNYWAGSDKGVIKFSFQKAKKPEESSRFEVLRVYDPSNGLANNNVLPILIDREQNIWFGTHNGLDRLISEKFVNYTTKDGLVSNTVYCTLQDKDGDIWIATDLGANLLINKILISLSTIEPTFPKERVYALLEDNLGLIWVGQYSNLSVYQKIKQDNKIRLKRVKVFYEENNIGSTGVSCLEKDNFGRVWIGSNEGIQVYDGHTMQQYTTKDGLANNFVNNITIIDDDQLWVGTNDGATLITGLSKGTLGFKTFQTKDGLSAKTIGHIIKDKKGNVWFSTEGGGLCKWDGTSFTTYTLANGLPNNVVIYLYEDSKGAIWVATYNGISKLEKGRFKNYNYKDGFSQKGNQVFYIMPDKENNLWFSTNLGLTKYLPEFDYIIDIPPTLSISAIKFNHIDLRGQDYKRLLSGETLSFSYKQNSLEIDFLGVSFIDESRVSYQYKLEPFDNEWQSTNLREQKYSSLSSGDYIFHLKALNSNGLSSEIKTIKFHIEKPVWLQAWFIALISIVIIGTSYGVYWLQIRRIEAKNQQLEALVQQRTNELSEQKSQLEVKNQELNSKNQELNSKNKELIESHKRADRIFSALAEALPGTILDGKYQLEEKIGAGGFGAVYRGTHLIMKRPIAVKVFRPSTGNDSTEALERFQLEAISASRINHPNVVAILDSGISAEGIAYLVMELLQGQSLKDELRKKKHLSVGRAIEILLPVCDVLSKAHEAGIIHRDIKPDNIFLHQSEKGEQVKLIDFGIAKWKEPTGSIDIKILTVTGGIIGTPAYMAPERFQGKCDLKSDVYSLAIVLYELLAGQVPFYEHLDNFYTWIGVTLYKDPVLLNLLNPTVSDVLAKEVMQAIHKDPSKRPTAKELAEKLLAAVGIKSNFTTDNIVQVCLQLHENSEIWQELDPAHHLSPEERQRLEAETMDLPHI